MRFLERGMAFLVRLFGWFLVVVAILVASMEAVMALGTKTYVSLATRDVWTLLAGTPPSFEETVAQWQSTVNFPTAVDTVLIRVGTVMMDLPAWITLGLVGGSLILASRTYRLHWSSRRRRLFRP